VFGVFVANNNCIPAHSGSTGSLIILHGARGPKLDPRLTDAVVGRSRDLRQPGGGGGVVEAPPSTSDVLSTLTELKPLQTYTQPDYLSPSPYPAAPYDGMSRGQSLASKIGKTEMKLMRKLTKHCVFLCESKRKG